MYNASDLRKGLKIEIDNEPYVVTAFEFSKPGKGQALYRCKLKNMITGVIIDPTYRSGDSFKPAALEERRMQFLYNQDDEYCFMDVETYDQTFLSADQIGDAKNFLIDNLEVDILFFGTRAIGVTLPNFVDLTVTQSDPWVKGDSVSGDSKPVTLETGDVLLVGTDGIWEAEDSSGKPYGKERLYELIRSNNDCSAQQMVDAVIESVEDFCAPTPPADDVTLIVIKAL